MTIDEHTSEFAGRVVIDWEDGVPLDSPSEEAYALRLDYEDEGSFEELFERFLKAPGANAVEALVIGAWGHELYEEAGNSEEVVEALVNAREQLPALRALFIGDITFEEAEISWIHQSNISPVVAAFPTLEILQVRGGEGLRFEGLRHPGLKSLVVQTGGLRPETFADILAADLPALEHLELWLGSETYGGTLTVADLAPLLDGSRFPKLTSLGLADSEIADELAEAIVKAPILARLTALDLSMGTLSDEGAEVLRTGLAQSGLKHLDLSENFLSEAMVQQIGALPFEVLVAEQKDADEYGGERYASVTE